MDTATTIITGLVTIGAALATWFVSKRREANKQASEKNKLTEAVYNGDKDALNKHLRNSLCIGFAILFLNGCSTGAVYVPSDREVYPIVSTNNVPGWFVPNAVMDDICRKLYDVKYGESAK
jgi:murein endopeptidase